MPDQPVEPTGPAAYPSALEVRVSHLESDARDTRTILADIKASLARLEAKFDATIPHLEAKFDVTIPHLEAKFDATIPRLEAKFDATIPHLATKEQVAKLPTREYLWGVVGVLIAGIFGAFGVSLAAYTVFH